jgi:hypothetical protein
MLLIGKLRNRCSEVRPKHPFNQDEYRYENSDQTSRNQPTRPFGIFGCCHDHLGFAAELPEEKKLAGGMRRNIARYVMMPDGTKVAVDIWLPVD